MKKNKMSIKMMAAISGGILSIASLAPVTALAVNTSGYVTLTSSIMVKGDATISTDASGDYNILTDSKGNQYELNSSSVINTTGLSLYLKNTAPAMVDSIKSSGNLKIVTDKSVLQVQPLNTAVAVDVKSFEMIGNQSPSGLIIYSDNEVGLRSERNIDVRGYVNLDVVGPKNGIQTGKSIWARDGARVAATDISGVGISADDDIHGINDTEIIGDARNGSVGIQSNSEIEIEKNSAVTAIGSDMGIYGQQDIEVKTNSFITGLSTSDSGIGVFTENDLEVETGACLAATGEKYGALVYESIRVEKGGLLNATSNYGIGIHSNMKVGFNDISGASTVNVTGSEFGVDAAGSFKIEEGSVVNINSTNGTALRIAKGDVEIKDNQSVLNATGVTGAIEISGKSNGVEVKKNATLNAISTGQNSTAIALRSKSDVKADYSGAITAQGEAGGIYLASGKVYAKNSGMIKAISNSSGTPIKADKIEKSKNGSVTENRA